MSPLVVCLNDSPTIRHYWIRYWIGWSRWRKITESVRSLFSWTAQTLHSRDMPSTLHQLHYYPLGASNARVIAIVVCLCVSVCLCVTVTHRYCIETAKRRITQTTQCDSPGTLVFWRQNLLVDDPSSPWNLLSKWPTPFQTPQFWPIFAHSTTTVRAGEKSSISTNRKSITCFPTSHRWTVYVTSKFPKGGTTRFCYFSSNFQLLSKKVCSIVSMCENVWRHEL